MHTILIWATFISSFLICFAVWRMLTTASENTDLDAKAKRRFKIVAGAYLFGWYFLMLLLAGAGVYTASPSLRLPSISIAFGVFVPIIAGLIALKISPSLRLVVSAVPRQQLIGVQFYRVLGAIFIGFYLLGELPAEFALPAGIGDIIVGVAAPLVAYLTAKNYLAANKWTIAWNVFGILDLIVAVACGFLSSPSPFQMLATDNSNRLITVLPLVLVPVFAVPLSILLHVASLKRAGFHVQEIDTYKNDLPRPASLNN